MRELVGKVTQQEQETIKCLFERKNGLIELSKVLTPDNELLYEKLVKNLGETTLKFQSWWQEMATKYSWPSKDGYSWEIDFDTNCVYLKKEVVG